MSQANGFEPENAPILEQNTNMPYAKRTVSFFMWSGLFVVAIIFFAGWYFSKDDTPESVNGSAIAQSEESDKSIVSAIGDAVEDVADGANIASPGLNAGLQLEKAKAAYTSSTAPAPIIEPLENKDDVNMRMLKNAQIIDFEGNITGEVDAVIYKDQDVDHIYFELQPSIAPEAQPRVYSIPYAEANIMETETGAYQILLNKEQTAAVAAMLLQE